MTISHWEVIVGVITSALLALVPWMFMVHAKLAVIASRIVDLGEKLEKAAQANHELWTLYAQHEARLDTHEVQLAHLSQHLKEIS